MTQGTCRWCGTPYTGSPMKRYCSDRCSALQNGVDAECETCGTTFRQAHSSRPQVYCSKACHRIGVTARNQRLFSRPCEHGWVGAHCPACTFLERAERSRSMGYRAVLKRDPCAYCGEGHGLDHIVPKTHGGTNTIENLTGCCKRCNETKRALSLLLALPWVPLSRAYHDQRRLLFAA